MSKTAFERELNDQGMPDGFDLSVYGIVKDHLVRNVKSRFGRWLRYNQSRMFEDMYLVWVKQKEGEIRNGSRERSSTHRF